MTARKREENIQDIPEALTAFTAQDIENAGITRIADVTANVPNIALQPSYRHSTVLFRLAGAHEKRDGYIRNSLTNDLLDFVDESTIRGTIYADFGAVQIDIRASYMEGENGASFYEALPLLADPVPEIDLLFGGPLGRLGSKVSNGRHVNHSNVQTQEERDVLTSSLKIEVDLAGGVVTSITGYSESNQEDFGDLDFQPVDILLQDVRFDADVFNTELRYASDDSERFRWIGGVFFQERQIYNQVIVLLGDFTVGHKTVEESRHNPANAILTDGRDTIDSKAWGVFLSTNYDLTDALTLTAAARYDKVDVATGYAGADPAFIAIPEQAASRTFQKLQPQFNLAYEIDANLMAYIDLARGFRTGVPNPTAAFAGGLPRFIEPEVADTAEAGVKSRLMDGRLILNGAVFYSDIENRHHYFYGASLQSMTTYDRAEVFGLEVDLLALLAPGLHFQASGGLMNAQIRSDEVTLYRDFTTGEVALTVNNRGNTLPDTPEKTLNLALEYDAPLTESIGIFGRAAYRYMDRIFFDTENYIDDGGSKEFVDLRLGLRGDEWAVTGFVDNVTDERTHTNYAYSGGAGNYLPNRPRIWGVEVSLRF